MIVDSHTHLFSKDFESYPRQSEPPEVRRVVASAEQLKAEMDAAGVDRGGDYFALDLLMGQQLCDGLPGRFQRVAGYRCAGRS